MLSTLLINLKLKLIAVGAILLGLFALYTKVKNKGRREVITEVNARTAEELLDSSKKTKKVHDKIRNSSDDDVRKSLRDRVQRTKDNSKPT